MNPSRIEQIRALFIQLKKGHDWLQRHEDDNTRCAELVDRSEPIFEELASLGVSKDFSRALLVFGPVVTDELVSQFEEAANEESK